MAGSRSKRELIRTAKLNKPKNVAPRRRLSSGSLPNSKKLTDNDIEVIKANLAFYESTGRYTAANKLGYQGRYQLGVGALEDSGYLRKGTLKKYFDKTNKYWQISALADTNNWTKKAPGGQKEFLANPILQEDAMDTYTTKNLKGVSQLKDWPNLSRKQRAGLLAAAHISGATGAKKFHTGGANPKDIHGSGPALYYKRGERALEISDLDPSFDKTEFSEVAEMGRGIQYPYFGKKSK